MADLERPSPEALAALVASHREFLAYVERRVGDRSLAEEILQDALVKSLDKVGDVEESLIGWFYRVLRNAIVDHARRRAAADRGTAALAHDVPAATDPELENVVCRCVSQLAETLKPEYADALQRIDIDGTAVKDYASEAGISASNADVRVFRTREALRKQVARVRYVRRARLRRLHLRWPCPRELMLVVGACVRRSCTGLRNPPRDVQRQRHVVPTSPSVNISPLRVYDRRDARCCVPRRYLAA